MSSVVADFMGQRVSKYQGCSTSLTLDQGLLTIKITTQVGKFDPERAECGMKENIKDPGFVHLSIHHLLIYLSI